MTAASEGHLLVLPEALPLPRHAGSDLGRTNVQWVDEAIYGHRFHPDQTPWMVYLEFLGVCAFRHGDNNTASLFEPSVGAHETVVYKQAARFGLRRLLHLDRALDTIKVDSSKTAKQPWREWCQLSGDEDACAYLEERFDGFEEMRRAVLLVREAEVEAHRNRRYTSRHLLPFGPDALTGDCRDKSKDQSGVYDNDRRFFARGGEMAFLMLNRSAEPHRSRLAGLIEARLLDRSGRWNRLVRALQPDKAEAEPAGSEVKIGYLPVPRMRRYDLLAEDTVNALGLERVDASRLHDPLVRLIGLHTVLYLIERGEATAGARAEPIVADAGVLQASGLRKLARDQLALHRELGGKAVRAHVERLAATEAFATAARQGPDALSKLFDRVFAGKRDDLGRAGGVSPEERLAGIAEAAAKHHHDKVGRVLPFYAEEIGLAASRRGFGRSYALADGLLEALVLANVAEPLEFGEFLERLHERYRLVVGPEQARRAFERPPAPHEQFRANQERLEDRLRALGFLQRLSDDCAFVANPYHDAHSRKPAA